MGSRSRVANADSNKNTRSSDTNNKNTSSSSNSSSSNSTCCTCNCSFMANSNSTSSSLRDLNTTVVVDSNSNSNSNPLPHSHSHNIDCLDAPPPPPVDCIHHHHHHQFSAVGAIHEQDQHQQQPDDHPLHLQVDHHNHNHNHNHNHVNEDPSSTLNNSTPPPPFDLLLLTIDDVSPIESARSRFLQIIVDHFITDHLIHLPPPDFLSLPQLQDPPPPNHHLPNTNNKFLSPNPKRKSPDFQYEGDPTFALPLMYVANLYESLIHDVNLRLSSLNSLRDKSIGVALEAAGGLYRALAKKFPKKGPCVYKRRELATSLETRTRFPELVIQEEKRVRFVVVNGLEIIEKPNNMSIEDSEWFKRLTGRNEVAVSARDYKFYSPRHKYRRVLSNIPGLLTLPATDSPPSMATTQGFRSPQNEEQPPPKHHVDSMSHQPPFHPIHQNHHQIHQSQNSTQFSQNHQCGPTSHLPEIAHANQSPNISQHMAYLQLQPLTAGHVGGRLHLMPTSPAKFCDECGAPYIRETSKFCSECGTKRLGM